MKYEGCIVNEDNDPDNELSDEDDVEEDDDMIEYDIKIDILWILRSYFFNFLSG